MGKTNIGERLPFLVSVCSRRDISNFRGGGVTHLLSIDDPDNPTPTPEWFCGTHWHLEFQDVESDAEARRFSAKPPTRSEVEKVLEYAASCRESSRTEKIHLLVHCMAGASRSPAAAFGILALLLGPGRETDAFRLLMEITPNAFPNKLVVQLADTILGRNGKMVQALQPLRDEANHALGEWAAMMESQRKRTK